MHTNLIIISSAALIIIILIIIYNNLVRLQGYYKNAFAQIETQLKRRYDLIPNLVETTKAYLHHENKTLLGVTQARNQALSSLNAAKMNPTNPQTIETLNQAEQNLRNNLQNLQIQIEAYPTLKANTTIMQFFEELTSTENRVGFARQAYNDAVTAFNITLRSFPSVCVAALMGFKEEGKLLEFEDSAQIQSAPKINFNS